MDTGSVKVNVVVRRAPGVRSVEVTGDVDQFGTAVLRGALDDAAVEHPDRVELHPAATG